MEGEDIFETPNSRSSSFATRFRHEEVIVRGAVALREDCERHIRVEHEVTVLNEGWFCI
jgi:hypothetical protein